MSFRVVEDEKVRRGTVQISPELWVKPDPGADGKFVSIENPGTLIVRVNPADVVTIRTFNKDWTLIGWTATMWTDATGLHLERT